MSIDTLINTAENAFNHKNEYHIASFVGHAKLSRLSEVKEAIIDTSGAEIHATSPDGKIVFTLEGNSQKSIGKRIDELKLHSGLLNLSPVYHQYIDETQATE